MGNQSSQTEAGYAVPPPQYHKQGENDARAVYHQNERTDHEQSRNTTQEAGTSHETPAQQQQHRAVTLIRRATARSLPSRETVEAHAQAECGGLLESGQVDATEGWESVFQDGERLRVWRRKVSPKSTAFEYALRGKTVHPPHVFFRTAFVDLENRLTWDESCGEARYLHSCERSGVETMYWVTKYPWPVAERDYVYQRIMSRNQSTFHAVSWVGSPPATLSLRDIESPSKEVLDKVPNNRVRVQDYRTAMLVRETPDGGALWCLRVFDDPKVAIVPTSVVNWIVAKTLPNSANKLEQACGAVVKQAK